jgi:hypothetical protein
MDDPLNLSRDPGTGADNSDHREREREARLAALRAAVQRGLDDVAAGRVVDLDEGIEQVLRSIREKKAAGGRE